MMIENNRKGLLLLLSHWDILGKLPPVELKNVLQAIFAKAGADCDMPKELSLLEEIAFEAVNKDVQWSFEQYEKTRTKRAEAGRKGGLKKAENAKKQADSSNNDLPSDNDLDCSKASKTSNATNNLAKCSENVANVAKTKNKTMTMTKNMTMTMTKNKKTLTAKENENKQVMPVSLMPQTEESCFFSKSKQDEINKHFDLLWKLYPNQVGLVNVTESTKESLSKVPKEDMQRFINRYKTEMKKKHENGFNQAWMNGSTWFNGRWEDYTDENYKPPEKIYKQNAFRSEKEIMEADAHWKMMEE